MKGDQNSRAWSASEPSGAYFADRLQPVLGDDLRVIAGGKRAERIRREGLVINGKQGILPRCGAG